MVPGEGVGNHWYRDLLNLRLNLLCWSFHSHISEIKEKTNDTFSASCGSGSCPLAKSIEVLNVCIADIQSIFHKML